MTSPNAAGHALVNKQAHKTQPKVNASKYQIIGHNTSGSASVVSIQRHFTSDERSYQTKKEDVKLEAKKGDTLHSSISFYFLTTLLSLLSYPPFLYNYCIK